MSEDASELSSWTLGSVKSSGLELEGACPAPGCAIFARFDVDALIDRFGADWRVPLFLPSRCSACGEWLKFQLAALHDEEPNSYPWEGRRRHSSVRTTLNPTEWLRRVRRLRPRDESWSMPVSLSQDPPRNPLKHDASPFAALPSDGSLG
jgi:hypothetical protein